MHPGGVRKTIAVVATGMVVAREAGTVAEAGTATGIAEAAVGENGEEIRVAVGQSAQPTPVTAEEEKETGPTDAMPRGVAV